MVVVEMSGDVERLGKQGELVEAARNGNLEDILQLLDEGVDVNVRELTFRKRASWDCDLKSLAVPLMAAAENGHAECVKCLVARGACMEAKDGCSPGLTALHRAAEKGHDHCVKELLEAGANADEAIKFPSDGSVYSSYGCKFYFNGTTALHLASYFNHVACVAELIEFGADYNAVDSRGRTSLYVATEEKNAEAVLAHFRYSVGRSTPLLSIPSIETGETPLHFCMRHCPQLEQCIGELIERGADVNLFAYNGTSPLMELLFYSDSLQRTFPHVLNVIKVLLAKAKVIDFNIPNRKGYTPLHYVAFFDHQEKMKCRSEIAALLLTYGANPHIRNKYGYTLFEYTMRLKGRPPDIDMVILKTLAKCMLHLPRFLETEEDRLVNQEPHVHQPVGQGGHVHLAVLQEGHMHLFVAQGGHVHQPVGQGGHIHLAVGQDGHIHVQQPLAQGGHVHVQPVGQGGHIHVQQPVGQGGHINIQPVEQGGHINVQPVEEVGHIYEPRRLREALQANYAWYLSITSSPRSLRHYARFAIRSALGPKRLRCINDLPLPHVLRDYLLLIGNEFL